MAERSCSSTARVRDDRPDIPCAEHDWDSCAGGNAHAFDGHLGDLVEGVSRVLESVIGRAVGGAEGLAAGTAAISATPTTSEHEETVADDILLAKLAVECTIPIRSLSGLGTSVWDHDRV